jgi:hypothetical protein
MAGTPPESFNVPINDQAWSFHGQMVTKFAFSTRCKRTKHARQDCEVESLICWEAETSAGLRGSFAQLRGPVQNHGHGCARRLFHLRINQKSLSLSIHVVDE